jgi:hypothetical protein
VVAARFKTSSARTMNNTGPTIVFETVDYDTHGAYNSSTGVYTIPVSGKYKFACALRQTSTAVVAGNEVVIELLINGSIVAYMGDWRAITSGSQPWSVGGSTEYDCKAGDTVAFGGYSDVSTTTQSALPTFSYASIERLSGPAVVQATESVNMRFHGSSTTITSSLAAITFTTKDFDSHNAYSGSTYTVPVSGKYAVSSNIQTSGTYALNGGANIQITKNGSGISTTNNTAGGAVTTLSCLVSDTISCVAGDTLQIFFNTTASGPSITSGNSYLSIYRVGN